MTGHQLSLAESLCPRNYAVSALQRGTTLTERVFHTNRRIRRHPKAVERKKKMCIQTSIRRWCEHAMMMLRAAYLVKKRVIHAAKSLAMERFAFGNARMNRLSCVYF